MKVLLERQRYFSILKQLEEAFIYSLLSYREVYAWNAEPYNFVNDVIAPLLMVKEPLENVESLEFFLRI